MALRIYNTLTGKKEEFHPLRERQVGMYACGVTVYDLCHIGHARSAIVFDVIYRYLRYKGYDVVFVRNFTDIDDKIIRRANEEGVSYLSLAERYIEEFHKDMGALGLEKPSFEPRATEHIAGMIRLITTLLEKGFAYQRDGNVFFSVEKFKGYGKLSKRNLEEMQAGARIEIDEKKENPLDFALWKASKAGEPSWRSPWGEGRPGWHIECSVMSQAYLGETFDIHGGGKDLIFPHHENEIAQSEAATGKPFARYWIHNGFVNIHKEKMSKSLGNILTIKEVLKDWPPEALRLFFLAHHYRSPVDYTEKGLGQARNGLDRFYATLLSIQEELKKPSPPGQERGDPTIFNQAKQTIESFQSRFEEAMEDDFNTALALGHCYELQSVLNSLLDRSRGKVSDPARGLLRQGYEKLREMGKVLGLFQEEPEAYREKQRREGLRRSGLTEEEILRQIAERDEARKHKDWKKADEIRGHLFSKGIILEDTPSGTVWKIK